VEIATTLKVKDLHSDEQFKALNQLIEDLLSAGEYERLLELLRKYNPQDLQNYSRKLDVDLKQFMNVNDLSHE
jgi:hypothetical protein